MELTVNGQRAYAYTGGKTFDPALPCVVFIHGAQNDHSVWGLQSRWFAHHGYAVLAVDLPGHGRSGGAPLASIEALADWIAALADAAGVQTATLVGHSMGSLTALEAAFRQPQRFTRLALIGTAVPMPVSDALLGAAKDKEGKAIAMINTWSHSPHGLMGGNTVPGMWMLGASRRLMERQAKGTLHNDLSACNAYTHGLDAAAAIDCPVLVLYGAKDSMTSPKIAAKLATAIRGAQAVPLAGTGHALMAEQPDAVLDTLRAFIVA